MPRGVRKTPAVEQRSNRPLLGGFQPKLKATKKPGMHQRIVNDVPGRVELFQEAGYRLVPEASDAGVEEGRTSYKTYHVGKNADGSGQRGYLMEKPEKWHEEDQARKQVVVDQREAQIFEDREPEHEAGMSQRERSRFYTKQADIEHNRR